MSSGLYEELGISSNATPEEIRKAYKKRALQTHPDRLPQGATAADKADYDEKFRRVNNAYEVLSDPKKRSEYDAHGVWPPPEEEFFDPRRQASSSHQGDYPRSRYPPRAHTFPDPFFSHHHTPFPSFEFTDPFTLFDSIFEGTPFGSRSSRSRHHSYSRPMHPFEQMHRMQAEIEDFMEDIDRNPFGMGGFGGFPFGPMYTAPALSSSNSRGGRWVSESIVSSTVNGVTQTVRKRVDSDGNEHIVRTLPDGREVRTINGIEQPSNDYMPQIEQPKSRRDSSGHRYISPPPAHIQPVRSQSRMDYGQHAPPPPPPYTPNPAAYRDSSPPPDRHRRSRRSSEKYAYTSSNNPDPRSHEERQHKKRFWQH
ncbi:DnaJ-domain-containing protein [Pholiota conissans]|uniref:DnaJ-domain-containing protein n=1 Tax=Pholiota conissans TaxID=109636 RepID=A0A9P6CUG3_9AGAR|nr:DnaJ-domain-containing protein [Pholiota conissans]